MFESEFGLGVPVVKKFLKSRKCSKEIIGFAVNYFRIYHAKVGLDGRPYPFFVFNWDSGKRKFEADPWTTNFDKKARACGVFSTFQEILILAEFNGFWFIFILSKNENLVAYIEFYETCFAKNLSLSKKSENKVKLGFCDAEDIFTHLLSTHFPSLRKNFTYEYQTLTKPQKTQQELSSLYPSEVTQSLTTHRDFYQAGLSLLPTQLPHKLDPQKHQKSQTLLNAFINFQKAESISPNHPGT